MSLILLTIFLLPLLFGAILYCSTSAIAPADENGTRRGFMCFHPLVYDFLSLALAPLQTSACSVKLEQQVLDTPRPAAVRCRARTDNVAGVKLPVFESYETGSEVGRSVTFACESVTIDNENPFGVIHERSPLTVQHSVVWSVSSCVTMPKPLDGTVGNVIPRGGNMILYTNILFCTCWRDICFLA